MALETQVQKFMKDDSAVLAKILKELEPTFKAVEATRKILPKIDINNLDKVKQIQLETVSLYGQLREWYLRIDALKKNKEAAYFQNLCNKASEKNEKFVAAVADKETSLYVAEERRVRDLIAGKLDFALETIKTCRNMLNEKQYPSQSSLTA